MTDANVVSSKIRSFIVQKFPAARKKLIDDDTSLLESGVIDSLGILDVVAFLEATFRVTVADDELIPDYFSSVNCMASFVENKVSQHHLAADVN